MLLQFVTPFSMQGLFASGKVDVSELTLDAIIKVAKTNQYHLNVSFVSTEMFSFVFRFLLFLGEEGTPEYIPAIVWVVVFECYNLSLPEVARESGLCNCNKLRLSTMDGVSQYSLVTIL